MSLSCNCVLQGGDDVRKPFDAAEMQLADRDQRFWESLLAATVTLTIIKVHLICNSPFAEVPAYILPEINCVCLSVGRIHEAISRHAGPLERHPGS